MGDPGVEPAESGGTANIPIDDSLHRAVNDCGWIAIHPAPDGHNVAIDFGVWAQLDIAQYGDHVAVHLGIDKGIAHDRNSGVAYGSGDPRIADHRNDILRFAV